MTDTNTNETDAGGEPDLVDHARPDHPRADVEAALEQARAEHSTVQKHREAIEDEVRRIHEPYDEAIQSLRRARDEATRELREATDLADSLDSDLTSRIRDLEQDEARLRWRDEPPTRDEAKDWWRAYNEDLREAVSMHRYASHRKTLAQAPRAPGYTTHALAVSRDNRAYLAFHEDGRLAAFLFVDPSEHPGDQTRAQLHVAGHGEVSLAKKGGRYGSDVWKPTKQFKAALQRLRDPDQSVGLDDEEARALVCFDCGREPRDPEDHVDKHKLQHASGHLRVLSARCHGCDGDDLNHRSPKHTHGPRALYKSLPNIGPTNDDEGREV